MGKLFVVIFIFLTAVSFLVTPAAAFMITLVGAVNENQQFVADNEVYEVDINAVGDDLVLNYIAQKVKVVGQLKVNRDVKVIKVESFEIVEE